MRKQSVPGHRFVAWLRGYSGREGGKRREGGRKRRKREGEEQLRFPYFDREGEEQLRFPERERERERESSGLQNNVRLHNNFCSTVVKPITKDTQCNP